MGQDVGFRQRVQILCGDWQSEMRACLARLSSRALRARSENIKPRSSLSQEESPAYSLPIVATLDVSSNWQQPIALSPVPSEILMPGGSVGESKEVSNSSHSSVRDQLTRSSRGVVRMYMRASASTGCRPFRARLVAEASCGRCLITKSLAHGGVFASKKSCQLGCRAHVGRKSDRSVRMRRPVCCNDCATASIKLECRRGRWRCKSLQRKDGSFLAS